jgi:glycosyltransferase involved in cell wall biosynthesis
MELLKNKTKVSIIIPCYNEEAYIQDAISSISSQVHNYDYEILVIDGMSTDKTIEKIKPLLSTNVKLFENHNRTKPFALNIGIKQSTGDYILIADAHSVYPTNYISTLVRTIQENPAYANTGCAVKTLPANDTFIAKAIAIALSSRFGVGSSTFRTGTSILKEVDTVPFGCFKREIFKHIGLFDTELTRNQDDELNARIINSGYKIALVPNIEVEYYARESLAKLWKMYYQYGFFKPLVNKKLGSAATIRQFAPPALILFLPLTITPYLLFLLLAFSYGTFISKNPIVALLFSVSVATMHFSYGTGYILGMINKGKSEVQTSR